jgi:MerR family transcriptional regulator, thiopeptide resistance regulator
MQVSSTGLRHVRRFAAETGVTVRTLHVYDHLGLLKPAKRTHSGYRLYGEAELERLEQILALRFVGFSLEQIKELLSGSKWPLVVALRMQREIIAQQKRRFESAIDAIEQAEHALLGDDAIDRWETLRTVMEKFKVSNDTNWTQEYYSEEARAKLAEMRENTPKEIVEQGQRDWAALIADVEEAASSHVDPKSARAQTLAVRWRGLVGQFTRGDADIHKGLNKLWSDRTHWPKDFKRPWSDDADAFIKKAMDCTK